MKTDIVYMLTEQELQQLKDSIAYANTLQAYEVIKNLKPLEPIGYIYSNNRNINGSVIQEKGQYTSDELPIYTLGEQK